MNKKLFGGIIVLMGISILGIIAVQLIWMNNAIRVKNELFNRSVNEALNNTVNKLEDIQHFSVVNHLVFEKQAQWKNLTEKILTFLKFPLLLRHQVFFLIPIRLKNLLTLFVSSEK